MYDYENELELDAMMDEYPDYSGTSGSSGLNENGEPTFG